MVHNSYLFNFSMSIMILQTFVSADLSVSFLGQESYTIYSFLIKMLFLATVHYHGSPFTSFDIYCICF